MTTGDKIKSLRMKRGISQEALANKINTTRQTIYHWENDITIPNINDISRLSKALDIDHDYFFNTSDDDSINSTDEVISEVYKGVKKHWRKIYINFFIGGTLFLGMGLLIRVITNTMFSDIPSSIFGPWSIFKLISIFPLAIGTILFIVGIILLIKDYQKQKEYQ